MQRHPLSGGVASDIAKVSVTYENQITIIVLNLPLPNYVLRLIGLPLLSAI